MSELEGSRASRTGGAQPGLDFKEGVHKMNNHTKKWLKAAGIRAVRTVAQTAIATIGAAAVLSEVNWAVVASASALAGVLSLLTSVAGLPEVEA